MFKIITGIKPIIVQKSMSVLAANEFLKELNRDADNEIRYHNNIPPEASRIFVDSNEWVQAREWRYDWWEITT
jgi:hypothetical protein